MLGIIVLACLWNICSGCGFVTHIELAYRARSHFQTVSEGVDYRQLLQIHEDAFQAGAPYPDAYYPGLCFDGEYHSISEDTHWTPFMKATVEYIRREYPRPWTLAGQKLVVFLLSVVSHQVTDVNWHSLDLVQGFLRTMGMVNYHGSYGDAHTDGDFGGDVLNLYGLDLEYIGRLTKWYVPTTDLYNIYDDYYGEPRMPMEVIENCTAWLFLGRLGETLGVVDKLYPLYARRSPFLIDHLQDYYLGGMDDMAIWTSNVWSHTIDMLDHGTNVCDLPDNPVFITCNTLNFYKHRYKAYKHLSKATALDSRKHDTVRRPQLDRNKRDVEGEMSEYPWDSLFEDVTDIEDLLVLRRTAKGLRIKPRKGLKRLLRRKLEEKVSALQSEIEQEDFGADALNVTEPQHYYTGSNEYGRLGESLQTGDYNGDGFQDLGVGAPAFSVDNNFQQGSVYIVYGTASGIPLVTGDIQEIANVTLSGTELNGRFGTAMATCDLNKDGVDDLAVSAPSVGSDDLDYQGKVYVYFGSSTGGLSTSPNITITCTQVYCNLGWSLAGADLSNDNYSELIIGAPFAPGAGEQRGFVGVLVADNTYSGNIEITEDDLDWIFYGEQDYSWLGYSVTGLTADDKPWILAGAPTYKICYSSDCSPDSRDIQSVGRVYVFEAFTQSYAFTLTSEEEFAQFGYKLETAQVSNQTYVFITAATADTDSATEFNLTQAGAVSVYEWSSIQAQPKLTLYGDRSYGRFGNNIMVGDFDGDDAADVIINAGLWSGSYFDEVESGRAFGFSNFQSVPDHVMSASDADISFGIPASKLRFGYSSAFIESSQGKTLVFGVPHSNQEARMSGEVALIPLM